MSRFDRYHWIHKETWTYDTFNILYTYFSIFLYNISYIHFFVYRFQEFIMNHYGLLFYKSDK